MFIMGAAPGSKTCHHSLIMSEMDIPQFTNMIWAAKNKLWRQHPVDDRVNPAPTWQTITFNSQTFTNYIK